MRFPRVLTPYKKVQRILYPYGSTYVLIAHYLDRNLFTNYVRFSRLVCHNCHILELQTLALKRASVVLLYVNSLSLDAFSVSVTFAKRSRSMDQPRECQVQINNHCRVCGYRLRVQDRTILRTIAVLKKSNLNISCFGIIISTDVDLHAFPSKFCKHAIWLFSAISRHRQPRRLTDA